VKLPVLDVDDLLNKPVEVKTYRLAMRSQVYHEPKFGVYEWVGSEDGVTFVKYDDHLAAMRSRAEGVPDGFRVVPFDPTEEQWGGLARDIVMWRDMFRNDRPTGKSLFQHLKNVGREIPAWLCKDVDDTDAVPAKGTVAAIIYKAMLVTASPPVGKCIKCGDRLTGHEDDSSTTCRWCVTGYRTSTTPPGGTKDE
jgi:hypothetical protein